MKFTTASNLAKTLIVISVVFCVLGLVLSGEAYLALRAWMTLFAVLLLIAALVVVLVFCKCPYCGKRIFFGANRVVYCPNCRRNLETGKKASKKKARTTMRK
jgi:hypothetical protein